MSSEPLSQIENHARNHRIAALILTHTQLLDGSCIQGQFRERDFVYSICEVDHQAWGIIKFEYRWFKQTVGLHSYCQFVLFL